MNIAPGKRNMSPLTHDEVLAESIADEFTRKGPGERMGWLWSDRRAVALRALEVAREMAVVP